MRKIVLSVFTILLLCFQVVAQNQRVSGTVTDPTGETMIGVAVHLKGTNVAAVTNIDGQYSINAPADGVLVFIVVGHDNQEIPIHGRTVIDVVMQPKAEEIESLVVIGYGSGTALTNVAGSHTTVGSKDLTSRPSPNIADALQGKVAGMQSWISSGEPTATASIRIRGISSINLSSEPLYILDGVPVSSTIFNQLNAYDIENVTVLKDAANTAIYGARAANGVVYITSKKGRKATAPRLNINAYYGIVFNTNTKLDMMNAAELIAFEEKAFPESTAASADFQRLKTEVLEYGLDFNWEKYIFDNSAPMYNMNAEISGGSENTRYLFSFGYYNKKGTNVHSSMDRYNFRSNIDVDVNKNLKIATNLGLSALWAETAVEGWYINSPSGEVFSKPSYRVPYEYEIIEGELVLGKRLNSYDWGWYDQFYYFENYPSSYRRISLNGGFTETWTPFKGLTVKANQNIDGYDSLTRAVTYPTYLGGLGNGMAYRSLARVYTLNSNNTIDYKWTWGDNHNFSALIGQEAIMYNSESFAAQIEGLTHEDMMMLSNGLQETASVSGGISEYVFNSYFGQFGYDYANKYFLNGTVRRDGSSRFGSDTRWGTFYSISGMWDLKKEDFLIDSDAINMFKFRVNYGETGNAGIGNYSWRQTFSSAAAYAYNGSNTMYNAQRGNVDLAWETIAQLNFGINLRLFNRLTLTVDLYNKATLDMLMEVPYSAVTGTSSEFENIGRVRNRGVEVDLSLDLVQTKDFYWGVNANVGYNKNTILELFNGLQEFSDGASGLRLQVGKSIGTFEMVQRVGIDPYDGAPIWRDQDGNLTKVWSEDNLVSTDASYYASWSGGFGTNLSWKNLSLTLDFIWCGPKYVWLNEYLYARNSSTALGGSNRDMWMMDIWTEPGQITEVPAQGTPWRFDSSVYTNAAFMRLKNATLSYTLPSKWLTDGTNNVIQGARVYVTGRNLLTFTNYEGYDPEIDTNGSQFRYPNSREVVFGIELTF